MLAIVWLVGIVAIRADDWPHWRGPQATGVSSEQTLPTRWSASENVAWKAALGGLGISTPIVSGDRVFVTSQLGTGISREGPRLVQGGDATAMGERPLGSGRTAAADRDKTVFAVEAFARADGKRLWERRIDAEGALTPTHEKHNLATPSPVTDGTLIFALFGTGQLVALDRNGVVVWQRHLGRDYSPFDIQWGHGSSPVLYGETIMLLCDHPSASYLVALDKRTGKERWKADRGKGRASYSTPLVVRGESGDELIVNSTERIDAYDPRSGAPLWHTGGDNRFPVPSPVFDNGVIFASRGYRSGPYMAIKPGGRGDITASHVIWTVATGAPYVSSLLHYGGIVYMANDVGVLTAVDAATGARVWQQRVDGVFSASPVGAAGHVYFVSENGDTIVIKASRTPEIVARNSIGERALASPAISNGRLFLRTDDRLIAIGK